MPRTITRIERQSERAIVLAAMHDGSHIQIGNASNSLAAHALHQVLDFDQNGYGRDERGRTARNGVPRLHSIQGQPVRFYRVREGSHEFGPIQQVPVSHVRKTHR